MRSRRRGSWWLTPERAALGLALLVHVGLWVIYPHDFEASDPWRYSQRAFEVSRHLDFGNAHVFNQRLAVVVPVAIAYAAFGVDLFTTHLWPLCAALMIVVVVWLALPDASSRIAGMALAVTSRALFKYSTVLWPDLIATAFMAASALVLFHRRRLVLERARGIAPVAAVSLLFVASLAKETAVWTLPLWVMALASDLRDGDRSLWLRRFHLPAAVAAVSIGVAYLALCHLLWSDALAHWRSVEDFAGHHVWSWDKRPRADLVNRLTTGPLRLLLEEYGARILLLAAVGVFVRSVSTRPWAWYSGWCLLLYWFGSASLSRYEPLTLQGRMTLPLLPGLLILGAATASWGARAAARLGSRFARVPGARKPGLHAAAPAVLVLVLTGVPFARYVASWRWRGSPEARAMEIVRRATVEHPSERHLLVCSDHRSPTSLAFYFGYQYPPNLRVVAVADLGEELLSRGRSFVFLDRSRSRFLLEAYGRPNHDREIAALGLTPAFESKRVVLFAAESAAALAPLLAPHRVGDAGAITRRAE